MIEYLIALPFFYKYMLLCFIVIAITNTFGNYSMKIEAKGLGGLITSLIAMAIWYLASPFVVLSLILGFKIKIKF